MIRGLDYCKMRRFALQVLHSMFPDIPDGIGLLLFALDNSRSGSRPGLALMVAPSPLMNVSQQDDFYRFGQILRKKLLDRARYDAGKRSDEITSRMHRVVRLGRAREPNRCTDYLGERA